MQTTETYDYTTELDDDVDCIQFGKYKDLTPAQLASTEVGRNYIVWAHKQTSRWIGSEELVERVHKIVGVPYLSRREPAARAADINLNGMTKHEIIEACELATYEAYGCFPKPLWAYR